MPKHLKCVQKMTYKVIQHPCKIQVLPHLSIALASCQVTLAWYI